MRRYDLHLLEQLNQEYRQTPFIDSFPTYDHRTQFDYADQRIKNLSSHIDVRGKKVLEVGCGGGHVSRRLATDFECEVVGVDIYESEVWKELGEEQGLEYLVVDLSQNNPFEERSFDLIVSFAAWEHMIHPFSVLQECTKLIKPDGSLYIFANLYRSAIASHLYRTIHFPFPHLLFSEDVIIEYCLKVGVDPKWVESFFYINKLTYSHYKEYFRLLNLEIMHESFAKRKLDLEFYERFEDKLGLYPIFDLELDFFEVILQIDDKERERKHIQSLTTSRVKSDLASPQKAGTNIRWSIEAFGTELNYAWYVYRNEERIEVIWYAPENYLDWAPTTSGRYKIRAFVRDGNNNIVSELSDEFEILG